MTMKIKRFISSILTAVLVLSICSVSAFAVTSEDTQNCVVNDDKMRKATQVVHTMKVVFKRVARAFQSIRCRILPGLFTMPCIRIIAPVR